MGGRCRFRSIDPTEVDLVQHGDDDDEQGDDGDAGHGRLREDRSSGLYRGRAAAASREPFWPVRLQADIRLRQPWDEKFMPWVNYPQFFREHRQPKRRR
jgi:hypothetical protein